MNSAKTCIAPCTESGDGEERRWVSSTSTLDLKLVAFHIELRLPYMTLMKTDMLNANKVFTRWYILGDSVLDTVLLPCAPVRLPEP